MPPFYGDYMKKRLFILTLFFTLLMGINVFAYSNSLSDFIDEYGYSNGKVITYSTNATTTVTLNINNSQGSVLSVFNTRSNRLFLLSNSPLGFTYQYGNGNPQAIVENSKSNAFNDSNLQLSGIFSTGGTIYKYAFSNTYNDECSNVDIIFDGTKASFDSYLESNPNSPNKPVEEDILPYFYLKVTSPANINNIEYTITWVTDGSMAQGHESQYGISVYLSGAGSTESGGFFTGFKNKKAIRSTDANPIMFNKTAFAFTFGELEKLYPWTGGFLDNAFWIYIKVVDSDGNPLTDKWVNFRIVKHYEIDSSQEQTEDEDGKLVDTEDLTRREDGRIEYTDNRPQGDDDNGNGEPNSNGSQVSPEASQQGISNVGPTEPQINGIDYGTSLNSLSANLQGLLNTVGSVPQIISELCLFLPAWLITLISVSIGMFVVIGVVKTILG